MQPVQIGTRPEPRGTTVNRREREHSASARLTPIADTAHLREAFGCFPSGVTAVCASLDGAPVGMLVSSFTSVSLQPPLVSICIMDASRTWSRLRGAPRLGVSILADCNRAVCQRFSQEDRFAGLDLTCTVDGAVLLAEASAWLDCSIHNEIAAGDHTIVLLRVEALHARPSAAPLVFHGSKYHRLSA